MQPFAAATGAGVDSAPPEPSFNGAKSTLLPKPVLPTASIAHQHLEHVASLPDRKLSRIGCVLVERVSKLRRDAESIWQAGVAAVDSERLVAGVVSVEDGILTIADQAFPLVDIDRIVVVGTGKAGAGMAAGFERAVGEAVLREKVTGWM